tara:strand:- start:389 stop:1414 length:1026 start_codon:yes stop_codon:yes gene_type:complete
MQEEVVNRNVPTGNGWKIFLVIVVVILVAAILISAYFMLRSSDDSLLEDDVNVGDGTLSGGGGEVDDSEVDEKKYETEEKDVKNDIEEKIEGKKDDDGDILGTICKEISIKFREDDKYYPSFFNCTVFLPKEREVPSSISCSNWSICSLTNEQFRICKSNVTSVGELRPGHNNESFVQQIRPCGNIITTDKLLFMYRGTIWNNLNCIDLTCSYNYSDIIHIEIFEEDYDRGALDHDSYIISIRSYSNYASITSDFNLIYNNLQKKKFKNKNYYKDSEFLNLQHNKGNVIEKISWLSNNSTISITHVEFGVLEEEYLRDELDSINYFDSLLETYMEKYPSTL